MVCPDCEAEITKKDIRCPSCGLNLKKFKPTGKKATKLAEIKDDIAAEDPEDIAEAIAEVEQEQQEDIAEGNGHKETEELAATVEPEAKAEPAPTGDSATPPQVELVSSKVAEYEEMDSEREIPGNGFLFNVKEKHLPEATRLNEREIWSFAVGEVQDAVLDTNRTESVFKILESRLMRNKISLGGDGRTEYVTTMQLKAEEKAEQGGDLFGRKP